MTLRPFGTKVHNFVTLLVKVCLTVVLQHAQFDCYSQPIITRQSLALFPWSSLPLLTSRGIYRLQYLANSEIRAVQNEPHTFISWAALLLRIGEWQVWLNYFAVFLSPSGRIPTWYLRLGHSRVLPNPFPFTIPQLDSTVLGQTSRMSSSHKNKKPVYVNIRTSANNWLLGLTGILNSSTNTVIM
jgi:hypothetical protein